MGEQIALFADPGERRHEPASFTPRQRRGDAGIESGRLRLYHLGGESRPATVPNVQPAPRTRAYISVPQFAGPALLYTVALKPTTRLQPGDIIELKGRWYVSPTTVQHLREMRRRQHESRRSERIRERVG